MKKLLLTGLLMLGVSTSALQAAPTLSEGNLYIRSVAYTQTLDWDDHEGILYGVALASGPGKLEGKTYIVRASCGVDHKFKCSYSVDLIDHKTRSLKINYLFGLMYKSKKSLPYIVTGNKRNGYLNVARDGEWVVGRTAGKWKTGDCLVQEKPGANEEGCDTFNRGMRLRINLADHDDPPKMLNLDITHLNHGADNEIIRKVEEYNTLSDYNGGKIGGFVKVLKNYYGDTFIQAVKCTPSGFGEWCSMSLSEITSNGKGLSEYHKRLKVVAFGRADGRDIYTDDYGNTVIPWTGYLPSGLRFYKIDKDVRFFDLDAVTKIKPNGEIQHTNQGRRRDATERLETQDWSDFY